MQKKIEKRSAAATQKRILAAAKKAFARKGLAGARVDEIALSANANKRMIYHYFGDKENLFLRVLENAYIDIRQAEQSLELDTLSAKEALDKLVQFTWQYYISNPEFITLVNNENLHRARHLKKSKIIETANQQLTSLVENLLNRGVNEGVFREDIDPVQLNITIAAIGYYYLTNRYTGTIIYKRDLGSKESFEDRLKFNLTTIQRLVHK